MIQSKTLGSRLSRLMIMLALVLITFVSLAPSSIRLWCPSAAGTAVNAGRVYFFGGAEFLILRADTE